MSKMKVTRAQSVCSPKGGRIHHPGKPPDLEDEVLDKCLAAYASKLKAADTFKFGAYEKMKRSQQLSSKGLLENESFICACLEADTSLRFDGAQLQDLSLIHI